VNLYAFGINDLANYYDVRGLAIETPWDMFNIGVGFVEFGVCAYTGNAAGAAYAVGGIVFDVAATLIPGVPGGASSMLQARRLGLLAAATNIVPISTSAKWHKVMINTLEAAAKKGNVPGDFAIRYIVRAGIDNAHHVVPKAGLKCGKRCIGPNIEIQRKLKELQERISKANIDIETDPANLVSLDIDFHSMIHGANGLDATYARRVIAHFGDFRSAGMLRAKMNELAYDLLKESRKTQ